MGYKILAEERTEFKLRLILNQGTNNPIANRISLQFFEIFGSNLINLPKNRIEDIKKILFDCMKDLLKAEELKNSYLNEENQAIEKIKSPEGIKFQPKAFSFEDPTETLKKKLEDFLIRCVIAIRKITKIGEIVFNKELKDHSKFEKHLREVFGVKSDEIKMIEEDKIWIKKLYDLRGGVEHDNLVMEPFDVTVSDDQKILLKIPQFPNGPVIREYVEVTLNNCFTFCEDMTAILLNTRCDKRVHIVQLPEEQRLQRKGFKYVIDLKGELKEGFLNKIQSKNSP